MNIMNTDQPHPEFGDRPSESPVTPKREGTFAGGSAAAAAVDMKVLEKLRAELAEVAPGLMAELIDLYLANTPGLLAKLRQAIAQGDAGTVDNVAHTLKSNSTRLGAVTCSELCQELEIMGQSGELKGAEGKLAQLEQEHERVRVALEKVR